MCQKPAATASAPPAPNLATGPLRWPQLSSPQQATAPVALTPHACAPPQESDVAANGPAPKAPAPDPQQVMEDPLAAAAQENPPGSPPEHTQEEGTLGAGGESASGTSSCALKLPPTQLTPPPATTAQKVDVPGSAEALDGDMPNPKASVASDGAPCSRRASATRSGDPGARARAHKAKNNRRTTARIMVGERKKAPLNLSARMQKKAKRKFVSFARDDDKREGVCMNNGQGGEHTRMRQRVCVQRPRRRAHKNAPKGV